MNPKMATGTVRWLPREPNGNPRLEINGDVYDLKLLPNGKWSVSYLNNKFELVEYFVTPKRSSIEPFRCTCPYDQKTCPGGCKHGRALRAALQRPAYPLD